ncbi:hypothetical protein LSM04_008264 [Trypanosoma melophagium]|uniref:uncharacterized protein n=1 Tax=Trypanosoma melophagium TaxID=715481 RepID=UPI00351A3978|nr:hypothetical protein LSM04_008264 [Trypanosoma melophagium]
MAVRTPNAEAVIRALKRENNALRRQLEEAHREVERLANLLHHRIPDRYQNNSSDNMERVVRLEQRCEQLASRLVSAVRDRQLSECAEVHFLLRTQEEERRFLRDALMTLLGKCKGYTCNGTEEWELVDGTNPGVLSALVLRVTEGLQSSEAKLKLEEAERLLVLEQISNFIVDVQQAIEKATRWVFNHHMNTSQTLSLQQLMYLKDQHNSVNTKGHLLVDIIPDSPPISSFHNQENSSNQLEQRWRESTENFTVPFASSSNLRGTLTEAKIDKGNLLEACDVLRACYRALGDVKLLLDNKTSVSVNSVSSKNEKSSLEKLLEGFQRDLQEVVRNGTKNREALARRLAAEIDSHRQTVNKYEARLKLTEKELINFLTASSYSSSSTQLPINVRQTPVFSYQKQGNKEFNNNIGLMNGSTPLWSAVDTTMRASLGGPATDSEIIKREPTPEWVVSPTLLRTRAAAAAVQRSGKNDIQTRKGNDNIPTAAPAGVDSLDKPSGQQGSESKTSSLAYGVGNRNDSHNTVIESSEIDSFLPITPPRRLQHDQKTDIMRTDTTGSPQQPKQRGKTKVLYSPSAF